MNLVQTLTIFCRNQIHAVISRWFALVASCSESGIQNAWGGSGYQNYQSISLFYGTDVHVPLPHPVWGLLLFFPDLFLFSSLALWLLYAFVALESCLLCIVSSSRLRSFLCFFLLFLASCSCSFCGFLAVCGDNE